MGIKKYVEELVRQYEAVNRRFDGIEARYGETSISDGNRINAIDRRLALVESARRCDGETWITYGNRINAIDRRLALVEAALAQQKGPVAGPTANVQKDHAQLLAGIDKLGGKALLQRIRLAGRAGTSSKADSPHVEQMGERAAEEDKLQNGLADATAPVEVDPVLRAFARAPVETDPYELAAAAEAERALIASGGMNAAGSGAAAATTAASAAIGQSRVSPAGDIVRLAKLIVDRPPGYQLIGVIGDAPDLPVEGYLFSEEIEKRYPVVLKADVVDASILSPADRVVRARPGATPPKPVEADQYRVSENGDVVHVERVDDEGTCALLCVIGSAPRNAYVKYVEQSYPILLREGVQRKPLIDPALRLGIGAQQAVPKSE